MYVSLTEIFVVMRKLGTFVARRLIVKSFHYRPASSSVLNMTLSAFAEANQPHAVASVDRRDSQTDTQPLHRVIDAYINS